MSNQIIGYGLGIVVVLIMIYLVYLPSQIRNRRANKRLLQTLDSMWEIHTRELIRKSKELHDMYDPEKIHERKIDENH